MKHISLFIFIIIPETFIQKAEKKYGMYVRNRYEAYNAKLLELQNSSTEVKLEEINNFFNKVPYGDDIDVWLLQNILLFEILELRVKSSIFRM